MKKQILCVPVLLALLFSACLPTPEAEPIVKPSEDLNVLIQKPQTELHRTTLPDRWEEDLQLNDCIIRIDAEITPATFLETPVYRSAWSSFDGQAERANRVKRVLLEDAVSYTDAQKTKSEYYADITAFSEMPVFNDAAGDWSGRHTDEQVQEYIALMQPWIEAAPDELTFVPFNADTDTIPDNKYYRDADGRTTWVFNNGFVLFAIVGMDLFGAAQQPESWVMEGDAFDGEPIGTRITGVTVSEEDAVAAADRLMQDCAFEGYAIAKVEPSRFLTEFSHSIVSKGYEITYARSMGSLPVTFGTVEHEIRSQNAREEDGYRRPWTEDTVTVYVDETGVRSLSWHYPSAEPEPVNESAAILPFEQIQDMIRIHLRNCFSWMGDSGSGVRLLIDRVGLYFGTFPMKDDANAFYYGPVWIARVRYCPNAGSAVSDPALFYTEYLHVNAIDGSLIHYNS